MKILMLKNFLLFAILSAGVFVSSARADLFGISSPYNDVFFGDYYGRNGDIEGHAAIKGNLDVFAYSFGQFHQNLHPASQGPTLVVGGNVKSSGATVEGDTYIAGTLSPQGSDKWNTLGIQGYGTMYLGGDSELLYSYQKPITTIPFDFELAEAQLWSVSSNLYNLANTVICEYVNQSTYIIDLTGKTGLQVVTIDAAIFNALLNTQNIWVNAGADTTLIINVTDDGNAGYLNLKKEFAINGNVNPSYGPFDGSNILINTDIDKVNISGVALNASLLALNAHIDVQNGNIDGQAFGASASTSGGGEFHAFYKFDDKHVHFEDTPPASVPEPATCAILACGLLGLGYANRRRVSKSF